MHSFTSLTHSPALIEPESLDSHSYSHEHGEGDHPQSHSHEEGGGHTHSHSSSDHGTNDGDMDKVRSTLKQLVRDWSDEVSDEPLLNQGQMQNPLRERGSVRRATPP